MGRCVSGPRVAVRRGYWSAPVFARSPRPRGGAAGAGCSGALALDSNTARHGPESCGVFWRRHAVIRLTSGIWSKHRRQTSGVQAICCSKVPRYSSAEAALWTRMPPIDSPRPKTIRFVCISVLPSKSGCCRFHPPHQNCPMNEASEGSVGQLNVKEVPHHPTTTFSSTSQNASRENPPAPRRAPAAGRRAASPGARHLPAASSLSGSPRPCPTRWPRRR